MRIAAMTRVPHPCSAIFQHRSETRADEKITVDQMAGRYKIIHIHR